LFDRTKVVKEPAYLTGAEYIDRGQIVGGDFFKTVPAGGDAYILKRILHDWNDQRCLETLRTWRDAMREKTRFLVIDAVVPPGNEAHPSKIMDILMMTLVEGRERTEEEFRELYRQAGLKLTTVIATPSVLSIVEGERD
jgi:hypothetical protein